MANGIRSAASRLKDYPDKFQECRERRHQWKKTGTFLLRGSGRDRYVVLRYECLTCEAVKTNIYDKDGEPVERRMEYPPGYLFHYTKEEKEAGEHVTSRTIIRGIVASSLKSKSLPEFEE